MNDQETKNTERTSAVKRLGAACCYVLKVLHFVWITILSTIAATLGYVICFLGLLAGQPNTSRDIARTLGIWWRE